MKSRKKQHSKARPLLAAAFLLALCVIVGIAITLSHRVVDRPTPEEKSGDLYLKTDGSEVRSIAEIRAEAKKPIFLKAGEDKAGWPVPRGSGLQPRISVSAKFPVSVAFIPEQYRDIGSPEVVRMAGRCIHQDVVKVGFSCSLDTSSQGFVLYIADNRSSGEANEIHVDARGRSH